MHGRTAPDTYACSTLRRAWYRPQDDPLKRPAFTEEHPLHVLEDFAERASACEDRLSELRTQLALADDITTEAARAAATELLSIS